jgi:hypothetical protein
LQVLAILYKTDEEGGAEGEEGAEEAPEEVPQDDDETF